MATLADITKNGQAQITKINATGEIRRRLLDMGIIKGTIVTVIRKAPLGDPIEIKIKGFNLSLRLSEAKTIEVEQIKE